MVDDGWNATQRFHELLDTDGSWRAVSTLYDGFPQWYNDLLVRLNLAVGEQELEHFDSHLDVQSNPQVGHVVAVTARHLIVADVKVPDDDSPTADFTMKVHPRSEIVRVDIIQTRGVKNAHRDEPKSVAFEVTLRQGDVIRLPLTPYPNAEQGKGTKAALATILGRL